jgi:hypothetical protein
MEAPVLWRPHGDRPGRFPKNRALLKPDGLQESLTRLGKNECYHFRATLCVYCCCSAICIFKKIRSDDTHWPTTTPDNNFRAVQLSSMQIALDLFQTSTGNSACWQNFADANWPRLTLTVCVEILDSAVSRSWSPDKTITGLPCHADWVAALIVVCRDGIWGRHAEFWAGFLVISVALSRVVLQNVVNFAPGQISHAPWAPLSSLFSVYLASSCPLQSQFRATASPTHELSRVMALVLCRGYQIPAEMHAAHPVPNCFLRSARQRTRVVALTPTLRCILNQDHPAHIPTSLVSPAIYPALPTWNGSLNLDHPVHNIIIINPDRTP